MKNYKKIICNILGILSFTSISTAAFTPNVSQTVRFQPGIARAQKTFTSSGTMTVGQNRYPVNLSWYGPGKYSVQISGLPRTLYMGDSISNQWILTRDGKNCSLKTDIQLVGCPTPSAWATLELSASGDSALKALKQSHILNDEDMQSQETDRKMDSQNSETKKRTRLNLGQNGPLPIAVIEIEGPDAQRDSQGITVPVVQYDQNFLAPLLLRINDGSDLLTWKAASDLEVNRENPRFAYVLSSRLEVTVGSQILATISRKDLQLSSKLPPFNTQRAIGDINALKNSLTDEGLNVLKALLLTH
jgi:hypothetical protein